MCDEDFPVTVRLSVDEFEEGGMDVALSKEISRLFRKNWSRWTSC